MTVGEAVLLRAAVLERLQELPVDAYRTMVHRSEGGDPGQLECRVSLYQDTGGVQKPLVSVSICIRVVAEDDKRPEGEPVQLATVH